MTEDKMIGWHHRLEGHEFEQAPGVGDGQEAWRAAVRGVAKSPTRLIVFHLSLSFRIPNLSRSSPAPLQRRCACFPGRPSHAPAWRLGQRPAPSETRKQNARRVKAVGAFAALPPEGARAAFVGSHLTRHVSGRSRKWRVLQYKMAASCVAVRNAEGPVCFWDTRRTVSWDRSRLPEKDSFRSVPPSLLSFRWPRAQDGGPRCAAGSGLAAVAACPLWASVLVGAVGRPRGQRALPFQDSALG